MIIDLPWPPTMNTYWRRVMVHGKPRTLLSARGRQYRHDVAQAVVRHAQHGNSQTLHVDRVEVNITAYEPDKRARDLDNLLKAPLDALAHCGVYADDSQIDALTIRRAMDRDNPRLHVEISVVDVS